MGVARQLINVIQNAADATSSGDIFTGKRPKPVKTLTTDDGEPKVKVSIAVQTSRNTATDVLLSEVRPWGKTIFESKKKLAAK